jgi:hypothetical protein
LESGRFACWPFLEGQSDELAKILPVAARNNCGRRFSTPSARPHVVPSRQDYTERAPEIFQKCDRVRACVGASPKSLGERKGLSVTFILGRIQKVGKDRTKRPFFPSQWRIPIAFGALEKNKTALRKSTSPPTSF